MTLFYGYVYSRASSANIWSHFFYLTTTVPCDPNITFSVIALNNCLRSQVSPDIQCLNVDKPSA